MTTPILSIVIVNWNTRELLKQCLESIFRSDKRLDFSGKLTGLNSEEKIPAEIIIVDNGSHDGSSELRTKNLKLKIKWILNDTNLGFSKANNQGIKAAKGEYVLLLNSDTIVNEGAISQTLFWLAAHSEADIIGCKLVNLDGTAQPSYGKFPDLLTVFLMLFKEHFGGEKRVRSAGDKIVKTDWVMGAFLMARRSVFREIDGLDEKIFMYMEEIEWCYRAKKRNFGIFYYPEAKIIHLGGGSSVSGRTDPILNIYKGLIYFYKKHRSFLELVILEVMLKIKALGAFFLGILKKDDYLKRTYSKALIIF